MPVYEYRALSGAGKNVNGIIDADSAVAARQKLRGSGIFPVEVNESSPKPKEVPSTSLFISTLFKRESFLQLHGSYRFCWGLEWRW
jgi:type II secretory pathway component PulF